MESNKLIIGALLFIIIVVGANVVMFVIARNWAKPNNPNFLETITKSLSTSVKKDDSMDELHQKLEELKKDRKE